MITAIKHHDCNVNDTWPLDWHILNQFHWPMFCQQIQRCRTQLSAGHPSSLRWRLYPICDISVNVLVFVVIQSRAFPLFSLLVYANVIWWRSYGREKATRPNVVNGNDPFPLFYWTLWYFFIIFIFLSIYFIIFLVTLLLFYYSFVPQVFTSLFYLWLFYRPFLLNLIFSILKCYYVLSFMYSDLLFQSFSM